MQVLTTRTPTPQQRLWLTPTAPRPAIGEYWQLLRTLPVAAYTCDRAGRITSFNECAARLWGREPMLDDPAEAFFGPTGLLLPDGTPLGRDACCMALALGQDRPQGGQELLVVRPDGSRVAVLAHACPYHDEAGQLAGAVGVLVDISERKRAEDRLREADARKDEFLAMLAHELRNPLAPLTNVLRLLERTAALGDREAGLVRMARRQGAQLSRLVDDLLEVARLTRGRIALRCEPLPIQVAVYNAVEAVSARLEQRGQRLAIGLPQQPSRIVADPMRVEQVLENLLDNASKYTPPGGSIGIEVEDHPHEIEIRVIDDGRGIDAAQLPRLFELFSQFDVTLDRTPGGLGIGLALVKHLVELHGGRVAARSAGRDRGATFSVWLPRSGPGEARPPAGGGRGPRD